MRPDEHKKRKNTQYKKKHGISGKDDKQEVDGKKPAKDKATKEKCRDKNDKPAVPIVKEVKVKDESTDNQEPEYDDFRRRKLLSNWSRYDESSDEEGDSDIPVQRGEDFNKLLNETGGSAAQFIFKDEEDWTDDQPSGGESVLALDLENLAESLSCVQLHQRLGISKDLLTEEQVQEIEAMTSENGSKYHLKYPIDPNTDSVNGATSKDKISAKSDDTHSSNKAKVDEIYTLTKCENNNVDLNVKKSSSLVNKTDSVGAVVNKSDSTSNSGVQAKSKTSEIISLEDDLDMLLSLDEPGNVQSVPADKPVSSSKQLKQNEMKLNIEKTKTNTSNVLETAALEDWLDTMLDE